MSRSGSVGLTMPYSLLLATIDTCVPGVLPFKITLDPSRLLLKQYWQALSSTFPATLQYFFSAE